MAMRWATEKASRPAFLSFSLLVFCDVSLESALALALALAARKNFSIYLQAIPLLPVHHAPGWRPPSRLSSRSQSLSAVLFSHAFPLPQGRKFLHDCLIHSDAGIEILQRKILVRRMSAAAGQGESEQERLHAENIAKIGNDRDAAAFANERDLRVESLLQGALRGLAETIIRIGQIPRA